MDKHKYLVLGHIAIFKNNLSILNYTLDVERPSWPPFWPPSWLPSWPPSWEVCNWQLLLLIFTKSSSTSSISYDWTLHLSLHQILKTELRYFKFSMTRILAAILKTVILSILDNTLLYSSDQKSLKWNRYFLCTVYCIYDYSNRSLA